MIDILPTLALCTRHANPDRERVRLWSLVLSARRFLNRIETGPRLVVAPALASLAVAEILAYEGENRPRRQTVVPAGDVRVVLLPLVLFVLSGVVVDGLGLGARLDWERAGLADAGLIRAGQWWRCVTALFLHADAGHLASNVAALGVLASLVARRLGAGLAWGLFVASGSVGNALNAWAQSATHLSLGASTGVFGLVGVLAAGVAWLGHGQRSRAILLALGFGFGFLALLGAGEGETRVDLGAHLFGLVAGLGLGCAVGPWYGRGFRSVAGNVVAAVVAGGMALGAWWLALTA